MAINTIARKITRNVQDYGWAAAARKSLAHAFSAICEKRTYRVYKLNLRTVTLPPLDSTNFSFKLLNHHDADAIAQIENMAEWLQGTLTEKIAHNDLCLVALDSQNVAGFNLITFGKVFIPLINRSRLFHRDTAWSEHIAVHKNYRKKGLASQLRYRIFAELRSRHIKTLYGGTLTSNEPALKLARKLGFREFVDVTYKKVLSFKMWRYERVEI